MKCRLKDPISAISDSDSPVFGMRLEDLRGRIFNYSELSDPLRFHKGKHYDIDGIDGYTSINTLNEYFEESGDIPMPSDSDLGVGDFDPSKWIVPETIATMMHNVDMSTPEQNESYDRILGADEVKPEAPSVYHKWFDEGYHDVYSIARKFDITDPAQAHGLKKNLIAGGRNKVGKSAIEDIKECIWSLQNYLEYLESLDEDK